MNTCSYVIIPSTGKQKGKGKIWAGKKEKKKKEVIDL